jgi:cation:H+ antiporter
MYQELIFLFLGIFGVWLTGELVINSSQIIARYFKISETFVGLTILSIGTSLAEMSTHVVSSLKVLKGDDVSGIAVGTNIGSNIVQITFILGLIAFFLHIHASKKFLRKDYSVMLGSIVLVWFMSLNNYISRVEGAILFFAYMYYLYSLGTDEHLIDKIEHNKEAHKPISSAFFLLIGIFGLLYSAEVVVSNGVLLAMHWNVRDTLIGTLLIGIGTALPELTTSLIAIKKKSMGMSMGVLVGSNITNPLMMLGLGAMISGYSVTNDIIRYDLPFWFFVSLLVLLFFWKDMRFTRKHAIVLMLSYLVYVGVRIKLYA